MWTEYKSRVTQTVQIPRESSGIQGFFSSNRPGICIARYSLIIFTPSVTYLDFRVFAQNAYLSCYDPFEPFQDRIYQSQDENLDLRFEAWLQGYSKKRKSDSCSTNANLSHKLHPRQSISTALSSLRWCIGVAHLGGFGMAIEFKDLPDIDDAEFQRYIKR